MQSPVRNAREILLPNGGGDGGRKECGIFEFEMSVINFLFERFLPQHFRVVGGWLLE